MVINTNEHESFEETSPMDDTENNPLLKDSEPKKVLQNDNLTLSNIFFKLSSYIICFCLCFGILSIWVRDWSIKQS